MRDLDITPSELHQLSLRLDFNQRPSHERIMPLLLTFWKPIALAVLFGGLLVWGTFYKHRYEAVEREFTGFKATTQALGEIAEKQAAKERLDRDAITKKQEAENATKYNDLSAKYAAARRMLNANPGSGQTKSLSDAASIISCPDRQADTAGRLERLEAGILNLIERGDKAIQRTIDCRNWITEQQAVK